MAIKKVVIAAAGRGTRMLHFTDDKPKHLIEINGKPFLFYVLDSLLKAGYSEIILVAGYKEELVKKFIEDYKASEPGEFTVKFVDQYEKINPEERYGTACPLMIKDVKEFIDKDQFLFICGDNLFSIGDLKEMNMDDEFNYVAGLVHEKPENYGVLIKDGGDYLEKIIEKPKEYVGNLINAGLYKFTSSVFEKLPLISKSPRGEYEITDVISLLAKEKKVKIKKIKDFWKDFGKPEDIEKLSKFLEDGDNKGK